MGGGSNCGSVVMNPTSIHENVGLLSDLTQWVKDLVLLCRSQTWLGSCVAVAVAWAGSCSSDSTPHLGTSKCCGGGPKKTKNKNSYNGKI